jgi:NitT/TauT family transport system permease protein
MAGLLLGWELLVRIAEIPAYTLPALRSWQDAALPSLAASWVHAQDPLGALALACVGGIVIASVFALAARRGSVLPGRSPAAGHADRLAPLILIRRETTAALLLCAWIVAFFPILSNTCGLRAADPHLATCLRCGSSRWQRLRLLLVPTALPYFLAGLKISGGLSLIGAVTAEMVAGAAGRETGRLRILEASFRTET